MTIPEPYKVPRRFWDPDLWDRFMAWRLDDPKLLVNKLTGKGSVMQRQWCIEARADFSDREKNDAIDQAFKEAAAHINATLVLLSDGQKPQVVCYSDDFFSGHKEIGIMPDTIGAAKQDVDVGAAPLVSDEMLRAVEDMRRTQDEKK